VDQSRRATINCTGSAASEAGNIMKFIQQYRAIQTSGRCGRRAATMAAVAFALAFIPRWAAAQETYQNYETPPETSQPPKAARSEKGMGFALSVAGGVSSFSSSSARDFINTGGTWDARGVFGTRTLFGIEAAYVGAAYGVDALGESSTLFGNGLELSGRLNILRNGLVRAAGLQPYLLGGVAWMHYHLSDNLTTAAIDNSDDTFDIPVGTGISYYFSHVLLDARFAYRFSFSDTLIRDANLNNYGLTGRIGAEF
jgi:hypothetical protein